MNELFISACYFLLQNCIVKTQQRQWHNYFLGHSQTLFEIGPLLPHQDDTAHYLSPKHKFYGGIYLTKVFSGGYPMSEGGWLNIFVFTIPIELKLSNRCGKHFIYRFMWSTQHCNYQGTAHWELVIKLT